MTSQEHRTMSNQLRQAIGRTTIKKSNITASTETRIPLDASFISPIGRTNKNSMQSNEQNEIESKSSDLIKRLHAKYDATNNALDAQVQLSHDRPSSPGLSPIHMSSLHSPHSAQKSTNLTSPKEKKLQYHDDHTCAHSDSCDHSIHSIRPASLSSGSSVASARSHRSSLNNNKHSHITFAEAAATGIVESVQLPSSHTHTRPIDLYSHAAERAGFFKLIQQLWEQQLQVYEQQKKHQQNNKQSTVLQSRSTMTTLTSTPNSTTTASSIHSNQSTPESQQQPGEISGGKSTTGIDASSAWTKQILSWENRLCEWKNTQESLLFQKESQLDQERAAMEAAMTEQEQLYEQRNKKYKDACEKLERERKGFQEEVTKNEQKELQLQQLFLERQRELSRKEAKFARQKKEWEANHMQQTPTPSTNSQSTSHQLEHTLHHLTTSLTQAFEEKERTLSELYHTKTKKLSQEIQEWKGKAKDLNAREKALVEAQSTLAAAIEKQSIQQVKEAEDNHAVANMQHQLDEAQATHLQALKDVESKWTQRAESWFTQRDQLVAELEVFRAAYANREAKDEQQTGELSKLQKQVDKLHSRLRSSEDALTSARTKIAALEDSLESSKNSAALLKLAEDKVTNLEQHLEQLRSQLSNNLTAQGHARSVASLTAAFEAELQTAKKQFAVELQEQQDTHKEAINEFDQALKQAHADLTQAQQTMVSQDRTLESFRMAMIDQQQQSASKDSVLIQAVEERKKLQTMLDEAMRRPITCDAQTDCSEVQDDLLFELSSAKKSLEQKSSLVAALQEELVALEGALHQAHEQVDLLRSQSSLTRENELSKVRQEAEHMMQKTRQSYEEELAQLRQELADANDQLARMTEKHAEMLANMKHREEVVQRQVELIETNQVDRMSEIQRLERELEEKLQAVENESSDLQQQSSSLLQLYETRHAQLSREHSIAESAYLKRQVAFEQRVTELDSKERKLSEETATFTLERNNFQMALEEFREQMKTFEELKRNTETEHTIKSESLQQQTQSSNERAAKLALDESILQSDRSTLTNQAEELKSMKMELEQWQSHVQKRDGELTTAIGKFEAHMAARESSCTEWEQRLHTVETKYSSEFAKMTDELSRLSLWETELIAFQSSLQAREKHLTLVERNLNEYLSPFDDSNLNSPTTNGPDSSVLTSPPIHANKLNLTSEQRKLLQTLTTPIMHRKYESRMTPSSANGAVIHASLLDVVTKHPSEPGLLSPASLYSPTRAEISITNDHEASFSQQ